MAKAAITFEEIWSDFQTLPSTTRDQFLEHLIADEAIRQEIEDLLDLAVVNERSHETSRPLEDVLAELGM